MWQLYQKEKEFEGEVSNFWDLVLHIQNNFSFDSIRRSVLSVKQANVLRFGSDLIFL